MSGFEKCPECGKYTLKYDEYYKRVMCLNTNCMKSELSSEKIRLIANEIKNICKHYKSPKCNKFLNNLNASCDGKYFYDGEGHALPISECPIKKENGVVK